MKKVKIIGTRNWNSWYAGKIGSEWFVKNNIYRCSSGEYYIVDYNGSECYIRVDDCEVISDVKVPDELFEL